MQKAYSFDRETVIKIAKGALIAMSGAAAIAGLEYVEALTISNPALATIVVWVVPALVNAVKEWRKGA